MFVPVCHAETAHVALSRMIPLRSLYGKSAAEQHNMRAIRRIIEDAMTLENAYKLEGWGWCYEIPLNDTEARWVRSWLIEYRNSTVSGPSSSHFNEIIAAQNFLTANLD